MFYRRNFNLLFAIFTYNIFVRTLKYSSLNVCCNEYLHFRQCWKYLKIFANIILSRKFGYDKTQSSKIVFFNDRYHKCFCETISGLISSFITIFMNIEALIYIYNHINKIFIYKEIFSDIISCRILKTWNIFMVR